MLMNRAHLLLRLLCIVPGAVHTVSAEESNQSPACKFTLSSYSALGCQDLFEETSGTIVANSECNAYPNTKDLLSGPGPYYRALCFKKGIAMLAARCSDANCTYCQDDKRFTTNGEDGRGWIIDPLQGACHSLGQSNQSFYVEFASGQQGEEPNTTLLPTDDPDYFRTPPPTVAPSLDSDSCRWQLDYFGSDNVFGDESCNAEREEFDISADGDCHYNNAMLYYSARSTDCGLVFDAAHCTRADCTACLEYSSGFQLFNDCIDESGACGFLGKQEAYTSSRCYARSSKGAIFGAKDYSHIWSFTSKNCGRFPRPSCKEQYSSRETFALQRLFVFLSIASIMLGVM